MEIQILQKMLESALPGAQVRVEDLTGGLDHFKVAVKASQFQGLSRLEQHRLVFDALGDAMNGPIHALQLYTETL